MSWMRKINGFFAIFAVMQLLLILLSQNVCAPGTISLTIHPVPPCVNINQSNDPVIMPCTITFDGYSALPYTVYVDAKCDVGEVYLTQNEFVFHYPETVPFDAIVMIDPNTANDTQGTLTIGGYCQEGGIQYNINPVSQIIQVLNYDPNYEEGKELDVAVPSQPSNDILFFYGFPSLLFRLKG